MILIGSGYFIVLMKFTQWLQYGNNKSKGNIIFFHSQIISSVGPQSHFQAPIALSAPAHSYYEFRQIIGTGFEFVKIPTH